ncbi:MAG TPA: gamma-glutamyl-gamma-aminobutyrate hydrolase family protein [Acetobacteraceae bacterium]|jgi:putative glutamine amidotransferase|nr:gamma-glutamyl-gamma-aminobutyrate hydrolase family protein [Acetobacteraceae bacterium]
MTPIIGLPACAKEAGGHLFATTPSRYGKALIAAADCLPVMIPPEGEAMVALLDRLDGLLLPGSPSNVEPALYGETTDLTPDRHDPARDATVLPLIRAALGRGLPLLAICRGVQELNVALGGTLHQQVQTLPGRLDHRGGTGPAAQKYRPKHKVALEGGIAELLGQREITVNSLHEQAIDRPGEGLVVEAWAPDGTIEAVRVAGSPFAFGVQWHPEWDVLAFADRLALFAAFGRAARVFRTGLRRAA